MLRRLIYGLAGCENYKISVRAATVNSLEKSAHRCWWDPERVDPLVDASASPLFFVR